MHICIFCSDHATTLMHEDECWFPVCGDCMEMYPCDPVCMDEYNRLQAEALKAARALEEHAYEMGFNVRSKYIVEDIHAHKRGLIEALKETDVMGIGGIA